MIRSAVAVLPLAAGLLLIARVPAGAVLPVLSTLSVAAGLVLAAVAYVRGFRLEREWVGPYEVAGALVFVGFAAALMTDAQQAFATFGVLEQSTADTPRS